MQEELKTNTGDRNAIIVQSFSCVRLFATLWTEVLQASLFFTISRSLLKLMSFELMIPSTHLILCRPLLLLPSIFPGIRVFSNESTPAFLPGEFYGQGSLAGYSPWGHKESDMTEH